MINRENLQLLWESSANGRASELVSRYSNLGSSNPFKGPTAKSLFYEGAKRNPGKYGQFLFYSLGNYENNFIDAYYRSESSDYNLSVSSIESKNPTAGFLVRETSSLESINLGGKTGIQGISPGYSNAIIGGLGAPYYWKDFLYCKYYGSIPNNYMITLRRFPHPVLDNLSIPQSLVGTNSQLEEGAGRPVAQAVTWFGGNTGNSLSTILSFTAGIEWKEANQTDVKEQEAMSKGAFNSGPLKFVGDNIDKLGSTAGDVYKGLSGIIDTALAATDPNETSTRALRAKAIRDKAKESGGLLSEYIWVPVDVVKNGYVRDFGLSFTMSGLDITFEYELTSVGEVNTKAALLDIIGNLLSIGTNYGNFLTPDIRYNSDYPIVGFPGGDAGLALYFSDPLTWLMNYGKDIANIISGADSKSGDDQSTGSNETIGSDDQSKLKDILGRLSRDSGNTLNDMGELEKLVGKETAGRLLRSTTTSSFIEAYQAPVSFLTGAPIGEWHLTIGNPCNPIAMIGNLLCNDVNITFGEMLGPDDFPSSIKAVFKLKHARDRERGEIESMFNRGDGRLYQSTQTTSADTQSYGAFADTQGNVLTYDAANQYMSNGGYQNPANIPDQQSPLPGNTN